MTDPANFHPCAISVRILPHDVTRYEIVYKHAVVDGHCTVCHEFVPRPLDLSRPIVKLDLGRSDA